jgi:hypothetical protein
VVLRFSMDHHGNVEQAIKTVEGKLLNVKRTILELLALLEMQEQVSWSQMITLFCTLSNQFSSLQTTMSRFYYLSF